MPDRRQVEDLARRAAECVEGLDILNFHLNVYASDGREPLVIDVTNGTLSVYAKGGREALLIGPAVSFLPTGEAPSSAGAPLGRCNRCMRKTWDPGCVGDPCRAELDSGKTCKGVLVGVTT